MPLKWPKQMVLFLIMESIETARMESLTDQTFQLDCIGGGTVNYVQ